MAWLARPEQRASNDPYNPNNDDPWLDSPQPDGARYGSGIRFWRETKFDMFLYQISPPRTMEAASCGRTVWAQERSDGTWGWHYPEDCWMNRFEDALARIGASICQDGLGRRTPCGWPTRTFVLFETTTYWEYRTTDLWPVSMHIEPGVTALVNRRAKELCDSYGVRCGFGTGFPD